ncbi:transcription factor MYB36 [Fagus crenata]
MGRAPCCDKANVKKGPWSPEEDDKLKAYIENNGTGNNWIALPQKIAQLPGRTDNDIKNYWNTRLKKKLLGRRKQSNMNNETAKDSNGLEDNNSYSPALLSNSAFERLQLHMQLQNLQNPFSFYNNPALWPKLHPLQEKMMIQSLQSLNEFPTPMIDHALPSPQPGQAQKVGFYEPPTSAKVNELENSLHGHVSSSDTFINGNNPIDSTAVPKPHGIEQSNAGIQASAFQAELDVFLNTKTVDFVPQEDQIAEFDCFKEMNVSKDSMLWWSNEFDAKSASLNSWDSTSVLHSQQMFQDYELGYNL